MLNGSRAFVCRLGLAAFIAVATSYCSSKSSDTTKDTGSTTGGTTTTPPATATPSGGGSTGTTDTSRQVSVNGSATNQLSAENTSFFALLSANNCAGQDFNVYEIGGGGNVVARAAVNNDGSFGINWQAAVSADSNTVSEVTLKFACATSSTPTVRCFGKPGDTNLTCDPISNAVVTALEASLGVSVETSADFKGLSVATLAQGLVETLKLAANLDPSADYLTELATATSPNALAAIINASPVGALFSTLQTVTVQTQVQNTSPTGDGNTAKSAALQALWTPDKVVNLLTGLGITINFNIDDAGNDGPNIYTALSTAVDSATGTTFLADFIVYLRDLYNTLYPVGGTPPASPLALLCVAQPYDGAATITYPPDVSTTNANQLTCFGPTAVSLQLIEAVTANSNSYDIRAALSSTYVEADRNDPDGTYEVGQTFNLSMSLIDVFEEINVAISPNGMCSSFVDYTNGGQNGPGPNTDWAGLGTCFQQNGLGSYFAGVVGVYSFLTDPALQGVRISINDIYEALIGNLGLRLQAPFPYFNNGTDVTLTDFVDTNSDGPAQVWIPWLLQDAGLASTGAEQYTGYCPAPLCDANGIPPHQGNMTTAQFNDLMQQTTPSLKGLFGELLNMPSFAGLSTWIFDAGHHVEYNTSGSRFYNVIGKDTNNDYVADVPILCEVLDANNDQANSYAAGDRITCQVATGNWNNGVVTNADYNSWFGLAWVSGTGVERYFALVDVYTGLKVQVNGQEFRIRDTSSQPSVLVGGNVIVSDGTTVYAGSTATCDYTAAGESECYVDNFSYVALRFPNSNVQADPNSFYPTVVFQPFSWPVNITQYDPSTGAQQQVTIAVGATNGTTNTTLTDMSRGYPICLSANAVVTSSINPGTAISLNLAGNVGNCTDSTYSSGLFYYLALTWDANTAMATANSYYYELQRSDGLLMSTDCDQISGPGNSNTPAPTAWCPPFQVRLASLLEPLQNLALFPSVNPESALSYSLANPRYSPNFDPFCADLDNSGYCDCLREDSTGNFTVHLTGSTTPGDADCNLGDIPGDDPTFSTGPVSDTDPSAPLVQQMMNACGNLSGRALATCLESNSFVLSSLPLNATSLFGCETPVAGQLLTYVDLAAVVANPNSAGGNCNANNTPGPVMMYKIINRNNAYDISRPQSALKLISTATQDVGTGVTVDPNGANFSFNEALALTFFRLTVPLDQSRVSGPNPALLLGANASGVVAYPGLQPTFTQVFPPDSNGSNIASAILRAFLNKTH